MWLARNDLVFNANTISAFHVVLKVDRMLLFWFSAVSDGAKQKMEGSMALICRSLDFLGSRAESSGEVPLPEKDFDLIVGYFFFV